MTQKSKEWEEGGEYKEAHLKVLARIDDACLNEEEAAAVYDEMFFKEIGLILRRAAKVEMLKKRAINKEKTFKMVNLGEKTC